MATDPEIREPFGPNLGEGDLGALGVRVERRPVELATIQLRSSTSSRAVYMPPDETLITRA